MRVASLGNSTLPWIYQAIKESNAFQELNALGVIAIPNATWDKSDAFHNCLEVYRTAGSPVELFGICYYTTQDIKSAIDGGGIYLGYSSTRPEDEEVDALRTGKLICEELTSAGLEADWDGSASSRIKVDMQWQLRGGSEL